MNLLQQAFDRLLEQDLTEALLRAVLEVADDPENASVRTEILRVATLFKQKHQLNTPIPLP